MSPATYNLLVICESESVLMLESACSRPLYAVVIAISWFSGDMQSQSANMREPEWPKHLPSHTNAEWLMELSHLQPELVTSSNL